MTIPAANSRRIFIQGAAVTSGLLAAGLADAAGPTGGDLYVIAEIVGKPEKADELRALIVPFAAKAGKEPGCREYKLMEVETEPGRFFTYERWTDRAALDAHMKAPALVAITPKLGDLLAKPFTQIFLRAPHVK